MSLVGTLGKIAVGVMVAKTATSVMKGARGGGGGGLGGMLGNALGGGQGQSGGGLGGGLGSLLGGGAQAQGQQQGGGDMPGDNSFYRKVNPTTQKREINQLPGGTA